ncbi:MAG: hypothetical protein RLZZ76_410 [Candidatus Parcubacteria bacterium]|jgi:hypothetical protein
MDLEFTQAQEQLQTRFDELPREIMDVIVGGTLDAIVFELTEKYSLSEAQSTALENEIILVLSFFIERSSFIDNVSESLNVEHRIAEEIGKEVQTEIFELVEEYFEAVEGERNNSIDETTKQTIAQKTDQKTDLQRLAEQFAQKSRLAQTTVQSAAPTEQSSTPEVVAQTPTEETPIENVQPLRTMQGDINRIHGYGAYNEMLEKEGQVHTSSQDTSLRK